MFLAEQKKTKGIRVDALTALATLSRSVASFTPEFVIGTGQGAVIAMLLIYQAPSVGAYAADEECSA